MLDLHLDFVRFDLNGGRHRVDINIFLFFIGEKFFDSICEMLDSFYLVVDSSFDALHKRLFAVFLQNEQISFFVVGLEAGVVPIFDKVMADILDHFACEVDAYIVPW